MSRVTRIFGRSSMPYTAFLLLVLLLQVSGLGCPISGAQAQSNNAGPPYSYTPDDSSPNGGKTIGPFPSLQSAVQSATQYLTTLDGPSGTNPKASCHLIYSPYTYYYGGFQGNVVYTASPGNTQPFCQLNGNDFVQVYSSFVNYDPGKNAGGCDCEKSGNGQVGATSAGSSIKSYPVNTATGNKYEQETDYTAPSDWLTLRRFYNSQVAVVPTGLGTSWRHSFDRSLIINSTTSINLFRPDGRYELFQKANGVWAPDADVVDTLTEQDNSGGTPTGYSVFVAGPRQIEQYSAAGLLQSITDPDGKVTTLTYSTASTSTSVAPAANLLLTVTDPQGRALNFTYNTNSQLAKVTQPDGGVLTYGYDTSGNLNSVQYPDGKTRQYAYNESTLTGGANVPGVLTGTIDESNARYESTTYNSNGWATSVYHGAAGAGIDLTTFVYGTAAGAGTTLTTPLGAVSNLGYQNTLGALKVSGSSAPCGDACNQPWSAQTYDANGYPNTVTDRNGNVTQTTYGSNGLLNTEIDASGTATQRTTTTTWNIPLRVPLTRTVLDSAGNTLSNEAWVYNTRGQATAHCLFDSAVTGASTYTCGSSPNSAAGVRQWTYTYCNAVDSTQCPLIGLLLSESGPRVGIANTTTYAYYFDDTSTHRHGDLKSVTNPLGHVVQYLSYDGAGRLLSSQDPNGIVTAFTYTLRGWLATTDIEVAAGNPAITKIGYTPYGAVASITDPDGVVTNYSYDAAHRLTMITDALGNYIQYTLDASGNRIREATYANGSTTPTKSLARTYNALGQLTKVTDGLGHVVFNASATNAYDGNGNLLSGQDAAGTVTSQSYDALNRLVKTVQDANGTDTGTANSTIQQSYDALNRLVQIIDPNNLNTKYSYSGLDDLLSIQSPDSGTTQYTYGLAGIPSSRTDAKGVTATYTYDAINRITSATYPDSSQNVSYYYDQANSITGCPSNTAPIGRLSQIVESSVTTVFCFNSHGELVKKIETVGSVTKTTRFTYTAGNRPSQIFEPDGTVIDVGADNANRYPTGYDAAGRPTLMRVTLNGAASATTIVSNVTYRPFGSISGYTLGNGQVITRSFDANDRITDIASPALNLHFALDAMGDITAIGNAAGANPATETYHYDPLYRLKDAAEASGSVLESYTYNPTGDRLSKTAPGLATGAYLYTAGTHQLHSVGNATRANDANGNTTGDVIGGNTYGFAYNARNWLSLAQLNGATVATYTYNALGQRIGKTQAPSTTVTERYGYDESNHLINESGATNRDYIWLGDTPIALVDSTANGSVTTSVINYVHGDGLNAPRAVTNSAGAVIWQWAYQGNPFGEQQPTSTTGYVLNLRYPGQYYDAETGTNYNVNRSYESATGRYLQSDPTGLDGGISTYAYVGNNPFSFVDPSGLARHKPDSLYCQNLANKIKNVSGDLDNRWQELDADKDTLEEYKGPGESLFSTRRGHRTLINKYDRNLRDLQDKYDDECGPPPPTTCPALNPKDSPEPNNVPKVSPVDAALLLLLGAGAWLIANPAT